jgi:hypothetical protein
VQYQITPRLGGNGTWHDPNGNIVVWSSGTRIKFTGIFDKSWSDPSCDAYTAVVP